MRRAPALPTQANAAFLAVGKLRHAHGVRGEILMEVFTDFPERLQPGITLYLGQAAIQVRLMKSRQHREGLLMTFDGYTSPEEIGQFRNQIVYVKTVDRPTLEAGEYYHHQLIGLQVVSVDREPIGTVTEILETGASDVLVVIPASGPEVLIPVVDSFIRGIDLARHEITAQLIPGMLRQEDGA